PTLVELESFDGSPERDGKRLAWQVTQEPFGGPQWISFTVKPHRYYAQDTLEMAVQHRLVSDAAETETAVAPSVRLEGRGGGGNDITLPLLLLALLAMRR